MKAFLAAATLIGSLFFLGCASTPQTSQRREAPPAAGLNPPQPSSSQTANPEGVVDVGPKVQPQEVAGRLVKGKTTMDEVVSLLGPPQHIAMNGTEGGRTLMYHWRKEFQTGYAGPYGTPGGAAIRSLMGPFVLFKHKGDMARAQAQVAAVRDSFTSLTLIFEGGILKDYQFSPPSQLGFFKATPPDTPALAAK